MRANDLLKTMYPDTLPNVTPKPSTEPDTRLECPTCGHFNRLEILEYTEGDCFQCGSALTQK